MSWSACYPEGRSRAVTLSYDDGQIHDRRLVDIFNRFGMKAAFHLNSGKLDREGFVESREIAVLYAGQEISCHGREHLYYTHLNREQLVREIWEDRKALEALAGYPVTGMSYPFGVYSPEAVQTARTLGIEYSRTVHSTGNFSIPENFLEWHPTCHHNGGILEKAEQFLKLPEYSHLPLFYVWGHSYEFARQDNWELMEEFCRKISGRKDTWYATNREIKRYLQAVRDLVSGADGTLLYNPSAVPVWGNSDSGKVIKVLPGETVRLPD